ncbi:hypothetical protein HAX54_043548 [Datura stramonium]|uniref:Uncharacterized protein n=1 Tax=Datura stramonium TaxID=4076 RepID=A0ABS8W388_DATST|nr:hypothetical protein [Datura stramonium]
MAWMMRERREANENYENSRKTRRKQHVTEATAFTKNVTAVPKTRRVSNSPLLQRTRRVSNQGNKPIKPLGRNSRAQNPIKPTFKRKVNNDEMKLQQKSDKSKIQMRRVTTQQNELKRPYEDAANMKFEETRKNSKQATKKKAPEDSSNGVGRHLQEEFPISKVPS